tara:strand:- start:233 stop:556 length:324 start_codon:yes stop_codon:yes gene_type:complete
MKSTSLEKNINILIYLKKFDGDWKNTQEISIYSNKVTLNRGRLDEELKQLATRGLIDDRIAENPKAKLEYTILPRGKKTLSTLLEMMKNSDIKHMAEIKENVQFDEV